MWGGPFGSNENFFISCKKTKSSTLVYLRLKALMKNVAYCALVHINTFKTLYRKTSVLNVVTQFFSYSTQTFPVKTGSFPQVFWKFAKISITTSSQNT